MQKLTFLEFPLILLLHVVMEELSNVESTRWFEGITHAAGNSVESVHYTALQLNSSLRVFYAWGCDYPQVKFGSIEGRDWAKEL